MRIGVPRAGSPKSALQDTGMCEGWQQRRHPDAPGRSPALHFFTTKAPIVQLATALGKEHTLAKVLQ
jgi:hypothetical protein